MSNVYEAPNSALHSDAGASRRFPRSLRSLSAGERKRSASIERKAWK